MQILILGAGGFIGSNLVEHFLERGEHEIVGVDIDDQKLADVGDGAFSFHRLDVRTDDEEIEELVAGSDVVIDLIAYANPSLYIESPLEVVDLNFFENLEVVDACVKHQRRLIQYSTCEVYGKPRVGEETYSEDESDLVYGAADKHRWIYACAKQLLERMIIAHGDNGDLEYSIIRPFNFIGPRMDYLVEAGTMGGPRVLAHFTSALLTGGPMYLVNGGEVHRSFTHIEDANQGLQAILDHPAEARNQIFNIGNPSNDITIRELAHLMRDIYRELTGREPSSKIVEVSGEEFYGEGYEDTDRVPAKIDKLRALGWEPTRELRQTFTDAFSYYLERRAEVAPTGSDAPPGQPGRR